MIHFRRWAVKRRGKYYILFNDKYICSKSRKNLHGEIYHRLYVYTWKWIYITIYIYMYIYTCICIYEYMYICILVHSGCCNKIPQIGLLINNKNLCLTVLDAGSLKLDFQRDRVRNRFGSQTSQCILTWWKGLGSSVGSLL